MSYDGEIQRGISWKLHCQRQRVHYFGYDYCAQYDSGVVQIWLSALLKCLEKGTVGFTAC